MISIVRKEVFFWVTHALICIEFPVYYTFSLIILLKKGLPTYYVAWTLLLSVICDIMCVLMHEMGHLLVGATLGFELFDLEIPFLAVKKRNTGWEIRICEGRQHYCYMKSGGSRLFSQKAVLYYFGGSLFNILAALFAFLFIKTHFLIAGGIIIYELSAGLRNIIPNSKRKYNDGTVIRLLMADSYNGELVRRQMNVLSDLLLNKALSEIECIKEKIEVQNENDLSFFLRIMKVYLELERRDVAEAREQIDDMEGKILDCSADMQNRFLCEKLFIYCLDNSPEVEKIYKGYLDKKPQKDIHYYISTWCYEMKTDKKTEKLTELKKMLEIYAYGKEEDSILRLKLRML